MRPLKTSLLLALALVIDYFIWHLWLPPMNLSSPSFWFFGVICAGIIAIALLISGYDDEFFLPAGIAGIIAGVCFLVLIIVPCFSGALFNSKLYASRLDVSETTFDAEFENVDWNTVPQIDDASSKILGDRKMGTLVEEVSQYNVSPTYTLINKNGKPFRVAPLEYVSLFKYNANKYKGIPGYVIVDCVKKEAEYIQFEKGLNYSPSAFFSKDLERHLRTLFPSVFFDDFSFEVDDAGIPYWVIPTYKYSAGIGGCKVPTGCILCDPVSGKSTFYSLDEIPEWVDHAIDDDTAVKLINWWGQYQDGWWNSAFTQKNVRQATEGNNFVTIGNDVYLYTGITSVALDESNIGFILVNQRTGKAKYFEMPSAEEYSAMDSAKGQVQHLAYSSTFPILINLNGKPTYFLSLKDDAGLVKMYALVSVADIQKLVVTESSLDIEHLVQEYTKLHAPAVEPLVETKTATFTIANIQTTVLEGNTQYYFTDANGNVYMSDISKSITLPVLTIGTEITVNYTDTSIEGFYSVQSIVFQSTETEKVPDNFNSDELADIENVN